VGDAGRHPQQRRRRGLAHRRHDADAAAEIKARFPDLIPEVRALSPTGARPVAAVARRLGVIRPGSVAAAPTPQ